LTAAGALTVIPVEGLPEIEQGDPLGRLIAERAEIAEGDVVVVCVDHANAVWKELQRRQHGGASADLPAVMADEPIDVLDDEMVAIEVDG